MSKQNLELLINRTALLHKAVAKIVSTYKILEDERYVVSFKSAYLSIENAMGALILISNDLPAPGFTLYRSQFDSLVRGVWLLHAASEDWVVSLNTPISSQNSLKVKDGVMVSEMLKNLDNSTAPKHIIEQLIHFRNLNWKVLSSFTHGGVHSIAKAGCEYPHDMVFAAIRNSNALISLAAQLFAILTGDKQNMKPVRLLHSEFEDCIPIIK